MKITLLRMTLFMVSTLVIFVIGTKFGRHLELNANPEKAQQYADSVTGERFLELEYRANNLKSRYEILDSKYNDLHNQRHKIKNKEIMADSLILLYRTKLEVLNSYELKCLPRDLK